MLSIEHVLNNPVWNALQSGNQQLGIGNDVARHFMPDIALFVALRENTPANFAVLYDTLPFSHAAILISDEILQVPAMWRVLDR